MIDPFTAVPAAIISDIGDNVETTICLPDVKKEMTDIDESSQRTPAAGLSLVRGRVLVAETDQFTVMTESGPHVCQSAASCLVRPENGDMVLVAMPGHPKETAYILAVLERAETDTVMEIDLRSGARLEAKNGTVAIEAGTGLRLSAGVQLEVSAQKISIVSDAAHWLTHTFSLLGKTVEAVCSVLRESSKERETVSETWTQRLGDSYRHIEELDETQAGTSRTLARETALLHGRVSYVQAEEFVKLDGQEVHLG